MKKILLVLLLLVLVFGCAKVSVDQESLQDTVDKTEQPSVTVEETAEKSQETTTPTEKEPEETKTATAETESTPETKPKVAAKTLDPTKEVQELLQKMEDKIFSVKYMYGVPPQITERNTYFIQRKDMSGKEGNLIKIALYEYEPTRLEDYWDAVFLNPTEQTATLYCLDRTLCQSKNIDKLTEKKDANYEDYMVKTPFDWAKEIPNNARIVGPEIVDGRTVTRFTYTTADGIKTDIWMDNTYGIPVQAEEITTDGTKLKYLFRDITFNMAKDEDFKPPF